MSEETFSRRHGYSPEQGEITIRDDAPSEVRDAILKIAEGELDLDPGTIRDVLCTVLRKMPDQSNWTAYPNVWDECQCLMNEAPWYKVYDFVEAICRSSAISHLPHLSKRWEELINEYFGDAGVGWRLVSGQLESRGSEAFELSVDRVRDALESAGLPTARGEIDEALRDLSRRPKPDLTGAVHHAMGALECTAREAAGNAHATLPRILKQYPDLVPKPLDAALDKMWGYASDTARHVREGRTPSRAEAELVVAVASAICVYLAEHVIGDGE